MHANDGPVERRLKADFPGWRIWRGKKRDGSPGSWCASRQGRTHGIYPTLVCDTAPTLRAELADQQRRADAGDDRPEDHIAVIPVHRRTEPDWNPVYIYP